MGAGKHRPEGAPDGYGAEHIVTKHATPAATAWTGILARGRGDARKKIKTNNLTKEKKYVSLHPQMAP